MKCPKGGHIYRDDSLDYDLGNPQRDQGRSVHEAYRVFYSNGAKKGARNAALNFEIGVFVRNARPRKGALNPYPVGQRKDWRAEYFFPQV